MALRIFGFEEDRAHRDTFIKLDPTKKWSDCLLASALTRGRPYELTDFVGKWQVLDDHYIFRSFEITLGNQMDDAEDMYGRHHRLGCGCSSDAPVIKKIVVTKEDVEFRPGFGDETLVQLPRELYVLVLHENGVIDFVPHSSTFSGLLAQLESYDSSDLRMNLDHADTFGCFSFGIVVGEGRDRRLMRLNRWATDNRYFWQAVNVTIDFPKGVDGSQDLISKGLAVHRGIDGSTPAGALNDALIALGSGVTEVFPECISAAITDSQDDAERVLLAKQPSPSRLFTSGLALLERIAKQIVDLFPVNASLREHPNLEATLRQLHVPDDQLQHLRYDPSVNTVSSFVDAVKSNVVKFPILMWAAEQLASQFPGYKLPAENERVVADVQGAILYCYAMHTLGVTVLGPTHGSLEFLVELFKAQMAAISHIHPSANRRTAATLEDLKQHAATRMMGILVDAQHQSMGRIGLEVVGELRSHLAESIILAAVDDVVKGNFDNARAGYELAYWGCCVQQKSKNMQCMGNICSTGLLAFDTSPAMMSEWVQLYILWNLTFGMSEKKPFLLHAVTLVVPCLLTMTNADPGLFLWMRVFLLNVRASIPEEYPESKQFTYDWRSPDASQLLGKLTKRLALQLSTLIEQKLGRNARSHRNTLGSWFSMSQHRVLEKYQGVPRDLNQCAVLGEEWLDRIRANVVSHIKEGDDEERHSESSGNEIDFLDANLTRRVLGDKVNETALMSLSPHSRPRRLTSMSDPTCAEPLLASDAIASERRTPMSPDSPDDVEMDRSPYAACVQPRDSIGHSRTNVGRVGRRPARSLCIRAWTLLT